ncbi:MAG: twin-arginine translocase TatA/TatE family subunit [Bryobacteraceae bacterium]
MGPIGMQEMVVIFLVALVLFGPKKLPELGKTIAKAVTEFRRAQSDLKATLEREMHSLERENEALKEATRTAAAEMSSFSDDLSASANNIFDPGPSTLPPSSTVSASEVPGAESPAAADAAAQVAKLLDTPSGAALEPGTDFGQPIEAAAAHEAARAKAIDAAIDAAIAEAQGHTETSVASNAPANPAPQTPETPVAAPEAAQHS